MKPRKCLPTNQSNCVWKFEDYTLLVFIFSIALEAPLRYVLTHIHATGALYLRDLLMIACIAGAIYKSSKHCDVINPLSVSIYTLLTYVLIGVLHGNPLVAALFSLKIFIPYLFGISFGLHNEPILNKLRPILIIWVILIGTVSLQYAGISFPWIGFSYDAGPVTIEVSKQWFSGGNLRLAGTARASYNAATIIGISCITLLVLIESFALRILISCLSLVAVYLTTTKGMFLALLISIPWMLLPNGTAFKSLYAYSVVTLLAALALFLPLFIIGYGPPRLTPEVPDILHSLFERFNWMWPLALRGIKSPIAYVLGMGLGSVGTPQLLFGNTSYGDNLFVYQYLLFGLLAFPIIFFLTTTILRSWSAGGLQDWTIGILFILFGYGLTANMIEEPFFSVFLGLAIGLAHKSKETRNLKHNSRVS